MDPLEATIEEISLVPNGTEETLNRRQLLDYAEHRRPFIEWMIHEGKNPERGEGYARRTAEIRNYRANQFYQWVWLEEDGYTTVVTPTHADAYMEELAYGGASQDTKANTMKAVQTVFNWREDQLDGDGWEPERTFSNDSSTTVSRDFLTDEERKRIREAALEYGSVPHYNSITPEERDRWETYLSQRFGEPKSQIGPDHFKRANGFKIPSLVFTALDAGLRPVEVERTTVGWVDTDGRVLRVPKEGSQKDDTEWTSALTERTTRMLSEWIEERRHRRLYDGRDELWLTREGNPYGSHALSYLLDNLCEIAGIDTTNRDTSWYSIRRSTTTYIIDVADLSTAQNQVRHKSPKTTARYDQSPPEQRRDALDQIG